MCDNRYYSQLQKQQTPVCPVQGGSIINAPQLGCNSAWQIAELFSWMAAITVQHQLPLVDNVTGQKPKERDNMDEQLRAFREALQYGRKLSPNTAYAYGSAVKPYLAACKRAKVKPGQPSHQFAQKYAVQLGKRLAASSLNVHLSAIACYVEWLGGTNPYRDYRKPKREKCKPRSLTRKQVRQMIETASLLQSDPVYAARNRALFLMLYATGGRISDVLGLNASDVAEGEHDIIWADFNDSKHDPYSVPVMPEAVDALRTYQCVAGFSTLYNGPLFLSRNHQRLSAGMAREIFRQVCDHLGLVGVTPHAFRHALGNHLNEHGCPTRYIQGMLGHASIASTQIYTQGHNPRFARLIAMHHPLTPEPHEPITRVAAPVERHRGDVPASVASPRQVWGDPAYYLEPEVIAQ